mmetsp:Transcript_44775/g.112606  ORF Transcript_44775/g.112606 Transcript_44775/m.112606 type:complete len:306 (-) Transcript_44775:127-1044(-)
MLVSAAPERARASCSLHGLLTWPHGRGADKAIADLRLDVLNGAGAVRDHDGRVIRVVGEVLQRVEVLRRDHHVHGLLGIQATLGHGQHRVFEAIGDRRAHPCHTLAGEELSLGIRLGGLHLQDLLRLALLDCRLSLPPRRKLSIHRLKQSLIGGEVCYQDVCHRVAVRLHRGLHRVQDLITQCILVAIGSVELHGRDARADHVVDGGPDLRLWVVDLEDRLLDPQLVDPVLNGGPHGHRGVVLRLALCVALNLPNSQGDCLHRLDARAINIHARLHVALELSELLHNAHAACRNATATNTEPGKR